MIKYSHGSISASGQERREELAPSPRNAGNSPFPAGIDVQTSYEQMLHSEQIFNHYSQLLWKQKKTTFGHRWRREKEGGNGPRYRILKPFLYILTIYSINHLKSIAKVTKNWHVWVFLGKVSPSRECHHRMQSPPHQPLSFRAHLRLFWHKL